ncbi:phage tail tape measure protein, TP901 family, core region [Pseudomonas flavescens]|uniref:Phage tail tape measure protein, TP901 family, core region n=1 Tax=Phytopseudomonas flavescens TaxID=29435 RepID=A0A1G8JZF7_9GAMM|nr:phage tail tape measure protein [Pseudomonas flavescens]SDI36509.1 phage tail tape measure protein, TP901 family, core region [Pseudomonas flavescens]
MAASNLKLQVILSALDRVTAPLKKIQGGSLGAGRALKEARDRLKELNGQQKDISAWRTQRTAAKQTEDALQAARDRVKALGDQMQATGVPTRQMTRDLKAAIRGATELKREHQQNQIQLQGLRNKLNAAGISTRNLGAGEQALKAKIAATNSELLKQETRLKRITQQQQRLARTKDQYQRTQAHAGSMAASGAGGVATGTGILFGMQRLLAPGVEFDTTMSKVQALTGLAKGDEQLAALRAQARKLGAETMFSAGDAASGQAFLAMAGFTPKAIQDAMPGLLDMAKAGDMDLGRTADIASNILGGFRIDPAQMGMVADVLTKAFTTSNMSLEMLGDTMKYVGPVAASAGMGLEQAAAMAGLLGNVGIQSSQAGTTLRAMLLRLAAPVGPAEKAMKKLGIRAKDSAGNIRDITAVLGDVAKATEKMGTGDRLEYLKAIFGEEPAAGMAELINQAGAGGILKYLDVVKDHAGAAGRTAKVMADNLTGDLDELFSGLDEVRIELFDQQNGPLREFVQGLTVMVGRIGAWVRENPVLTAQITKTVAGLGLLMAVMGGITLALASILGPFAMVRFAMMLLGIKSLGLVTGIKAVGSVLLWLGRIAMANPIGLLITVLAGGAYLIYKNWDAVKAYMAGLWAELKEGFSGGIGSIIATLVNFSPLGLIYRAFAGVLSYLGVELPSKFTDFGGMLMDGMVNGITAGLGKVKSAITGAGESTISWFKEKLGIHSPSRVFAQLGGFTMAGLGQGLAKGEGEVLKQVASTAKQLTAAGAATLGLGFALPALADQQPLQFDRRAPLTANAGSPTVIQGDTITINISAGPGTDTAELQRMLNRLLDERERNKATRLRSSLRDMD